MRIENQEINQIKLISKMKICEHLTSTEYCCFEFSYDGKLETKC